MTPSIWTDAFKELEAEDSIERIARAGWQVMELAGKHWRDLGGRKDPDREFESLKGLIADLGISIPQMHGPMFNVCGARDELEKNVELALRSMHWGAILGVKLFVFHPGTAPHAESNEPLERVKEENISVMSRLAEEGRKLGMTIALENLNDSMADGRRVFGATPPELIWLTENTEGDNVRICWDTGHAHLQSLDQGEAIRAIAGYLVATHIADNNRTGDQHLLPFEGTVDWQSVVATLKEIGFNGTFNLEVGGAMHPVPLPVREAKLRYALKLTQALISGEIF